MPKLDQLFYPENSFYLEYSPQITAYSLLLTSSKLWCDFHVFSILIEWLHVVSCLSKSHQNHISSDYTFIFLVWLLPCIPDFLHECLFEITWQFSWHLKFSMSKEKLSVTFPNMLFPQSSQSPYVATPSFQLFRSKICMIFETSFFLETSFSLPHISHLINQESFKIFPRFSHILQLHLSNLDNSSSIAIGLCSPPLNS